MDDDFEDGYWLDDECDCDLQLTPEQIEEINRRIEDLKSGKVKALTWEEVKEKLWKEFK